MCIVLFAYKTWPGYHLVLAANRDEYLQRPTKSLHYWEDEPHILAGRDLQAGGTWLGVDQRGRMGLVTNFRETRGEGSQYGSRGEIVPGFLGSSMDADFYLRQVIQKRFKGVNVLLAQGNDLFYGSNRLEEGKMLAPGLYGLSNHLIDTPWPKVERGKDGLVKLLDRRQVDVDELFALLQDEHRPEEKNLPDTGIGVEWEKLLSSIFITSTAYGTRSSAIVLITDEGHCQFHERRFSHNSRGWQETGRDTFHLRFQLG